MGRFFTATVRLTLFYAVSITLLLVVLSGTTVLVVRFYQNNVAEDEIDMVVKEIAVFIAEDQTDFSTVMQTKGDMYAHVLRDGRPCYISDNFNFEIPEDLRLDRARSLEDEDDDDYMIKKTVLSKGAEKYELTIVKDMHSEKRFLLILFFVMLGIDIAGVIISVILGIVMAKQVLKPVKRLAKSTKQIRSDNLSYRVALPRARDEIYWLTKAINEMSERLEQAFMKQKQFVSDASHELRTPLASIKGYANLIDRWGKDDRAALEKSVGCIQEEAEYMTVLIDKLLYLARIDKRKPQLAPWDLCEIMREEAENMRVYSENHIIECDCEKPLVLETDKALVQQLIRILSDNAIKFTPEGGTITLGCRRERGKAILSVSDTGCGIAPESLDKIFDRFYTENSARSKDVSGNGLGLSIALSICETLKCEIKVESALNEGTRFNVIFRGL